MTPVSPELLYTTLTAAFTGLLWIPVILNRVGETGMWAALKNPPPATRPCADWAYRLAHAHTLWSSRRSPCPSMC